MKISGTRVFAMLAMLTLGAGRLRADEVNLLANGGFEQGTAAKAAGWGANGWGGATGEYGRTANVPGAAGTYCYDFKRSNSKGGLQLFSSPVPIDPSTPLRISYRYRGQAYAQLRFLQKVDGKYRSFKDARTGKEMVATRTLKSDEWTTCNYSFDLPAECAGKNLAVRIYFLLFGGHPFLQLDDVSLIQQGIVAKPATGATKQWLHIQPPTELPATESGWYSPFPDPGFQYGMKDGVLTRDGKPFFYVGNFTVGGGQWNVASSWLARLQKSAYATVTWSIGTPSMTPRVKGDRLNITYRDTAPLYSWIRELSRYGMLTQFDPGNAMYKYSPLRYVAKKFPQLNEFYVQGSHFYCFDHNTSLGRQMHTDSWKNYFKYIRNAPLLAFESFNELGYTPSHARVMEGFRDFARQKYSSLEQANRCWGEAFDSWKKVRPPHLGKGGEMLSYSQRLFFLNKCRESNLYTDWLLFLQQDLMPGLIAMKKDFRALSDAPFSVDWRGHLHDFDNYVTADPDLLQEVVDLNFLHSGFTMYDYNGIAADETSVLNALTRSLLAHNFVAANSTKPIVNPESIYTKTTTPGSSKLAMEQNSFGKFHKEWQFTLEDDKTGIENGYFRPEFDDSKWGKMAVPGCWDATEQYEGRNGWGWYRTTFHMTGSLKQSYLDGSRKFLIVGKGIAQSGTIWLNGHKVGEAKGWSMDYRFDVGAHLNFGGENSVAILVDGTQSYSQGLRFYFHILADDMLNDRRLLEKKEYASILWTNLTAGCSGVTLWHWDDALRLFMPELASELNSVSSFVLPAARQSSAQTAMLMPYLHFRGMPAYGKHLDYLAYFAALTFRQTPVDLLGEKQFARITPERYPLVLAPYAGKVHQKTYEKLADYVRSGGFAVVTFDSLQRDVERYSDLPIESLAGVKIGDPITSPESIRLGERKLGLMKTDDAPYYGVKITPSSGTTVLARFQDGSPAVTLRDEGRGKVCFVAARLTAQSAHALLSQLLEQQNVQPELKVASSNQQEFPFVQCRYLGTPERFLLYAHNWGGQTHRLRVKIPVDKLRNGTYRLRNVRGHDSEVRSVSARELSVGIEIVADSMNPVAYLAEFEKQPPLPLTGVSPLRQSILKHVAKLNQASDLDSVRPKMLFMGDVQQGGANYAVGRKLYPLVAEFAEKAGCDTAVLPWQDFTPENLKKVRTIFLGEDTSNCYTPMLRHHKGAIFQNLLDFVKGGGSLIVVSSSAHPNSRHILLDQLGKHLGFSVSRSFSRDPASCGHGDPLQLTLRHFSDHPLATKLKSLQMFVTPVLNLKAGSPMKPVALTAPGDLLNPSKPAIIAGQYGKGRIIACTDLLWLQPFRLEEADNARLLMNIVEWTLGRSVGTSSQDDLQAAQFITSAILEKIEQQETN
jgi:hypothetical protein